MSRLSMQIRAFFAVALALLLQFGSATPARAVDDARWMFDPAVFVQVNLTVPDASMEQISCDLGAPRPYVPATFSLTYTRSGSVVKSFGPYSISMKVKGQYGSFRCLPSGEKAGLKLKFPSGSRPDGLKKLTLNNMVQDGSMVREVLSYEVFRSLGVASPRTGYAQVTINGTYRGIYLNVETMDDVALPRWFTSTEHLYEGSYGGWWGDVSDAFSGHYEVDEGDEDDRSDLQLLLDTSRNLAPGWYARMHPLADLEQMTTMWAAEWSLGHWDGYSQDITNNYYLHSDASGRFSMLPWGTDQAFQDAELYNSAGDHFLYNGCISDPICNGMYSDALALIASRWRGWRLDRRADALYRLVSSESGGVADVKAFIAAQSGEYSDWLRSMPGTPTSISVSAVRGRPGELRVTWRKPRSTVPITSFAVEYRKGSDPWQRVTVGATVTSRTLTGLSAGSYTVRVRSISDWMASPSAARSATVR